MSNFRISLNIVSTTTKACIRHLLKIPCWFRDIDLNWNQVLIGQHLDPWPITYALLIKVSLLQASTNFHGILVLCQNTPLSCMLITLLWLCSQSTSASKSECKKHFCQSICVFLNLNWNHTIISSKFQAM